MRHAPSRTSRPFRRGLRLGPFVLLSAVAVLVLSACGDPGAASVEAQRALPLDPGARSVDCPGLADRDPREVVAAFRETGLRVNVTTVPPEEHLAETFVDTSRGAPPSLDGFSVLTEVQLLSETRALVVAAHPASADARAGYFVRGEDAVCPDALG